MVTRPIWARSERLCPVRQDTARYRHQDRADTRQEQLPLAGPSGAWPPARDYPAQRSMARRDVWVVIAFSCGCYQSRLWVLTQSAQVIRWQMREEFPDFLNRHFAFTNAEAKAVRTEIRRLTLGQPALSTHTAIPCCRVSRPPQISQARSRGPRRRNLRSQLRLDASRT